MRRNLVGVAALGVLAAGLVAARDAGAAARRFAWLQDTDVLPERNVELEWWVWERARETPGAVWFVASGVIGLTDHLELSLPLELGIRGDGERALADYGLDLRVRLASADPAKVGPLVPLLRLGARRLVQSDEARLDLDAVLSLTAGRLHAVIDAGGFALTGSEQIYLAGGAGVSLRVTDELRVGAELHGEISLDQRDDDDRWISAGPNLSYTHGRFWLTASLPIGLHEAAPDLLPRVIWGVAF